MIIFYIYVINHISDYLSTCLRNSQLPSCYEPVVEAVTIPVEEDGQLLHQVPEDLVQVHEGEERDVGITVEENKQLLHQVREDIVQLLGGEGREVVLATFQDTAALAAPAHDEFVRDVGSSVLNEPVLSSAPSSVANLASYSRDAGLLWMQVISGDQNVGMLAQTSASPRHGEIGGKFSLCRSPCYLP